jgi:hypothetical protein
MTTTAASRTNSSIARSLRAPAAPESGNSCALPHAVNARTATSRMKPCRPLGGCATLTAAIAPATSSSGAAEAPAWWAQWTLPPIPSAVSSTMLAAMEVRPSPMAAESRTFDAPARGGWSTTFTVSGRIVGRAHRAGVRVTMIVTLLGATLEIRLSDRQAVHILITLGASVVCSCKCVRHPRSTSASRWLVRRT